MAETGDWEKRPLEMEGVSVVVVVVVVVRMARCEGAKAPTAEAARKRVNRRIIAGCIDVLNKKILQALLYNVVGRVVGP